MQEVLIDSDILSYFLKGDKEVYLKFNEYGKYFEFLKISNVSYYEIISGLKYFDPKKRIDEFRNFVNKACVILPVTNDSIEISSSIYAHLRQKGTPIDDIDLLIAGIALENNLVLVTNNTKYFNKIEDLTIENWKSG